MRVNQNNAPSVATPRIFPNPEPFAAELAMMLSFRFLRIDARNRPGLHHRSKRDATIYPRLSHVIEFSPSSSPTVAAPLQWGTFAEPQSLMLDQSSANLSRSRRSCVEHWRAPFVAEICPLRDNRDVTCPAYGHACSAFRLATPGLPALLGGRRAIGVAPARSAFAATLPRGLVRVLLAAA